MLPQDWPTDKSRGIFIVFICKGWVQSNVGGPTPGQEILLCIRSKLSEP